MPGEGTGGETGQHAVGNAAQFLMLL